MNLVLTALAGLLRGQRGAAAAEYAVLLALIAGGLALSVTLLGQSISDSITNTSELLNQSGCDNNGRGTGFGGGSGGGQGQGAGRGRGNTC